VVDPAKGRIVICPNMKGLSGLRIGPELAHRFGVPVAIENDVNLGTLGETWLGAAARSASAVGIFIGTGIGGGIVINRKLISGYRGAAGEIGHMQTQIGGPRCGCGAKGCLEAVASRTAIERDIRQAVAKGRRTVLTRLIGKNLSIIKSSMLKWALEEKDPLVTKVMAQAALALGHACVNIRHVIDPETIVLGGGVVEACGWFLLPIIEKVIATDSLPGSREGGHAVASVLGDDAVALGAVALAAQAAGKDPLKHPLENVFRYPFVSDEGSGGLRVADEVFKEDLYIRLDGAAKKRRKLLEKIKAPRPNCLGPEEVLKVCKGNPATLIIGTGRRRRLVLSAIAKQALRKRNISVKILPTRAAVNAWNSATGRKAAIFIVDS
jgi:glucokinase